MGRGRVERAATDKGARGMLKGRHKGQTDESFGNKSREKLEKDGEEEGKGLAYTSIVCS